MSTFVFAPSWVTYPNQPNKKTDEFPSLLGKSKSNDNKLNHNNVWSNSHLIRKIHHSTDDEDELEEKRYELERLKALVPKTKRSTSSTSSTSSNSTTTSQKRRTKPSGQKLSNNNINQPKETPFTASTMNVLQVPKEAKTKDIYYYTSLEEQQHFFYFIKSWACTAIVSPRYSCYQPPPTSLISKTANYNNQNYRHNDRPSNQNYSHNGDSNSTINITNSSNSSISSNNSSNQTLLNDTSYFYYNPFPFTSSYN